MQVDHLTPVCAQVCLPAIGLAGLLGNLGAILILLRPEMKSTFHHTLITLAVTDILFVITLLVDSQRPDLNLDNQIFIMFFPYVWNPAKNIVMTFETFLMMSITTERYLAIRNPLEHRFSRSRFSPSIHLTVYILPALLASVLLNIPKFFETELVWVERVDASGVTVHLMDYKMTSLRHHPAYILYYTHWTRLLTTGVLPAIYLGLGNLLLVRALGQLEGGRPVADIDQSNGMEGRKLRVHRVTNKTTSNSIKMKSHMLIAIVVIYLVCSLPRLALNLTEYLLQDSLSRCPHPPYWFILLLGISSLCLTINSSINFLIYYSMGNMFKAASHR